MRDRRVYLKRYHQEHRDHKVDMAKKWTDGHLVKHKYHQLRSKAKYQGLDCSITFGEYAAATASPCHYCGGPLPKSGYGLDRINSDIGYVTGNIRPCCYDCNKAKSAMTETEFAEWVLRVLNHWVLPMSAHKL